MQCKECKEDTAKTIYKGMLGYNTNENETVEKRMSETGIKCASTSKVV